MFGALSDLSDLACPAIVVDEGAKMVLVTWRCPASGFVDATDTFLFDDNTLRSPNRTWSTRGALVMSK